MEQQKTVLSDFVWEARSADLEDFLNPDKWILSIPPYQRTPDAWNKKKKKNFVLTVLTRRLRLPETYLNRVGKTYRIADGLQRKTTLDEFHTGRFNDGTEFKVSFKFKDGSTKEISINDLREADEDSELEALYEQFKKAQINLVIASIPSLEDEVEVFEQLNNSEKFTSFERRYCGNRFYTRMLLDTIVSKIYNDLSPLVFKNKKNKLGRKSKKLNKSKQTAVEIIHKMIIALYDVDFNRDFPPADSLDIGKKNLDKSAALLHSKVHDYFQSPGKELISKEILKKSELTDPVLDELGFNNKIVELTKYMSILKDIKSEINAFAGTLTGWDVVDLVYIIHKLVTSKQATLEQIRQNKKIMAKFVVDFINFKDREKLIEKGGSTVARAKKFRWLDHNWPLDRAEKNKLASQDEKRLALLNSVGVDPITKEKLDDSNVVIDHKDPKSVYGKTDFVALHKDTNRLKSSITKEISMGISDFQNETKNE